MPVRIYEIAKKIGIPSKEVLAKAKELGIANAKVASSTLDKITAEYLEEQIAGKPEPEAPAEEPQAAAEPVIITAPVEEAAPQEAEAAEDSSEETSTEETEPATEEEATEDAEPEAPAEEAEDQAEPAEPAEEEEKDSDLGKKVGFIELGNMPVRPAVRERKKKKDKGKDKQEKKPEKSGTAPEPTTVGGGPRKPKYTAPADGPLIALKPPIIVRDLAEAMKRKPFQLIADLMSLNVFANVNQSIEEPIARDICAKNGFRFRLERRERGAGLVKATTKKKVVLDSEDKEEDLQLRAPVVTIMGHVDHGKTTLLDVIRHSNVTAGEAGGITQHIGAYTINVPHPENPKKLEQITFLDTPGHAAFSAMRARGANVTDIVILVVGADDGVMPQTMEALSHAQAAEVPIIVAVNKIDHPSANPTMARTQLQEKGVVCEEWGGETIFVDVSALKNTNVDKLLEMVLLQAEVLELKANPNRSAVGNVVESAMEAGGPTATLLVRKGTLKVGDIMVCGNYFGKARALIDHEGKRIKEAGPSSAVKVLGLNGVPEAGAEFNIVPNDKEARNICEDRITKERDESVARKRKMTLESLFSRTQADSDKTLKLIIKADTQGSVEAIVDSINKIESDKVQSEVVHSGVGSISESDATLASASDAVILGFHAKIDTGVGEVAKREGVQIKLYAIIYELIEEVKEAMAGLLDPLMKDVVTGQAEVRKIFELSKGGNVAGCAVTSGKLLRGKMRVVRKGDLVYEGISHTLKRFKDEVNEVRSGMECGIRLDGFDDFQEGDIIECYTQEKVAQSL
ncbi:MAG: translation initiation factor IF-2 [Pedosphaera sp.]|nr:translation initiation factor IF-2 [Pedosphaera sp.]HBV31707.1 translation initiation factor IF-2 [Verrucomicrobiales bacterium]|tara:strand:- start:2777 stop:5173 length:2397 start_codon:yes stop_codon:yes gene_type:complete